MDLSQSCIYIANELVFFSASLWGDLMGRMEIMGVYGPLSYLLCSPVSLPPPQLPEVPMPSSLLTHRSCDLCLTAQEVLTFFCMLLIFCTWQNCLLYFKVKRGYGGNSIPYRSFSGRFSLLKMNTSAIQLRADHTIGPFRNIYWKWGRGHSAYRPIKKFCEFDMFLL